MPTLTAHRGSSARGDAEFGPDAGLDAGLGDRSTTPEAAAATALAIAGVVSIFPVVLYLWALWTTDPLKSIGGLVPLVSLVLILRVWRRLRWEVNGSWWGLAVLAGTMAVVHLRERAVLELVLSPSWSIFLPPHSLVAFAYASGAVLLFGGARLYRAALFPIALMWFVNPVPHAFNHFIDLPLQHAAAAAARGFAHLLGQRLTSDQLSLMFSPQFGMFIAPGCDGMRGAITMGFIALIVGYVFRFRRRAWVLTVAGAVLLGYVFNLVRLCVLVLYYVLALRMPALQGHAEMADYILGATLFFVATILLLEIVRRANAAGGLRQGSAVAASESSALTRAGHGFWWRWAACALVVAASSVPYARGLLIHTRSAPAAGAAAAFPQQVGRFRLRRMWPEKLATGQMLFEWADYAVPGTTSTVSVGVSPTLGAHDSLLCHSARGEDWLWHGTMEFDTASGQVEFSGALFNDGATQYIEATTLCSDDRCGQRSTQNSHFGLIYSRLDTRDVLGGRPARPVPVLLRVETPDPSLPAGIAQAQLTGELQSFLAGATLDAFTRPFRQP